jgi:hypothetical protein
MPMIPHMGFGFLYDKRQGSRDAAFTIGHERVD